MTAERFTKQDRVRRTEDFARIYRRRCSAADETLVVYGCENGLDRVRLGLSVSRKLGPAVLRNRWKRLLRDAFRLTRARLPKGLDLVVIPRQGVEPKFELLAQSLPKLAHRVRERVRRDRR